MQVDATRWLVDICAPVLAVLPLSAAGGAAQHAVHRLPDMRAILSEGDVVAVSYPGVYWRPRPDCDPVCPMPSPRWDTP